MKFNNKIRNSDALKEAGLRKIVVLKAEVIRLKDARSPGGFRYLAVETEMQGKYDKWNNNNGYVSNSNCMMCHTAQAFRYEEMVPFAKC